MAITSPHISKETFVEILHDNDLVRPDEILLFQTLYSLDKKEASASDLARILGWTDKIALIGKIRGLANRILKKYDIEQRVRPSGTKAVWDFFFTGHYEGTFFLYGLKPELSEALEECGLVENIKPISLQKAFLFTWNPEKWDWTNLDQRIEELQNTGKVTLGWKCASHKSIRIGDRAFIAQVGLSPRGIFASGKVASEPFISKHFKDENKDQYTVLIEFDVLLNPATDLILTIDSLNKGNLSKQTWSPQASGISIQSEAVNELEKEWFEFLSSKHSDTQLLIEKIADEQTFLEGAATKVTQTRYERDPYARQECLNYYGYSCAVCKFNFEKFYGNIGYKFIHVHHLTQIASVGQQYHVNPIKDLRPVCPNCHAMLHKQNPPISIEELKEIIASK